MECKVPTWSRDLTIEAEDPHRYAAIVVVGEPEPPTYLWENGVLHALPRGLRGTVYGLPRAKHELLRGGALDVEDDVVVDGGVVTAAGPHAAREFARAVVREMAGEHQRAARSRSYPAPRR